MKLRNTLEKKAGGKGRRGFNKSHKEERKRRMRMRLSNTLEREGGVKRRLFNMPCKEGRRERKKDGFTLHIG